MTVQRTVTIRNDTNGTERTATIERQRQVTVAATVREVTVNSTDPTGYEFNTHSTTQTITADTRTKLLCDAAGLTFRADRIANRVYWDETNSKLISAAASRHWTTVRVGLPITTVVADRDIVLEFDIGNGFGTIAQVAQLGPRSAGVETLRTFTVPLFILAEFAINGCEVFVTVNGDATINGATIMIGNA